MRFRLAAARRFRAVAGVTAACAALAGSLLVGAAEGASAEAP